MAEKSEKPGGGGLDAPFIFFVLLIIILAAVSASDRAKGGSGFFSGGLFDYSDNAPSRSSFRLSEPKDPVPSDTAGISGEIKRIQKDVSLLGDELQKTKTSPWSKYVSIADTGTANIDDPNEEYITVEVSESAPQNIVFTGWEIKSGMSGRGSIIFKGTKIPYWGALNNEEAIVLWPGDRVYITSGRSPIGTSFRVNKCVGYFEQYQNFSPSLRRDCPYPGDEDIPEDVVRRGYNDACINYIERLSRCHSPPQESVPEDLPAECKSYIASKINYDTCTKLHRNDADFFKNEWRIYLKQPEEVWKTKRELIRLLDTAKQTVDTASY